MRFALVSVFIFFVFLFAGTAVFAADVEPLPVPAKFIVSITSDNSGGVWLGSEDDGVFRCDNNGNVKQYTTKDGLGDDNGYALAVDRQNRLWVGHQYSGVSVFNGKKWQNDDVIDGPVGERIFDIQICPVDGDVWIATSAGLAESDKMLQKIRFVRGKDYADKVRGLYGGAPKDWKECTPEVNTIPIRSTLVKTLIASEQGKIQFLENGTEQKR
ncbi:MAG: hypothetical protein LBH00_11355 [Planctomycetaceae bacterium]|nr:hypothetical protein [Planctomycetaceae bacterium]